MTSHLVLVLSLRDEGGIGERGPCVVWKT